MEFKKFKNAVAAQFKKMCSDVKNVNGATLYRTNVSKNDLWNAYLTGFPEGTNVINPGRVRPEYDCSACRSFIKAVGNVIALTDNGPVSIWDIEIDEPVFKTVADALATLVKNAPIQNVFMTAERTAGVDKNFEEIVDSKSVVTWEHFFVNIPLQFVVSKDDIGTKLGKTKALHDVAKRSLDELTADAVETVFDLITQNSLYRGEEHKATVKKFKYLKEKYDKIDPTTEGYERMKDEFVWDKILKIPEPVAKIRNTSIGTLLIDLSSDVSLEEAVRKFESVVAPANYKRPTALVTPRMIEDAKKKVEELGLTSALERRFAVMSDISINDILFVDRSAKKNLSGNVFDDIAATVPDKKAKSIKKVETITIDEFIANILPTATSVEVMFDSSNVRNLVSLIAPVDPTAGLLFKWNNNFSLTYNGDMADSIKEKVKAAGGNVTGDLCCRLAWFNYDDLDFHMKEPGGNKIMYNNKISQMTGGKLDVDMNAGNGTTREPVENIFYGFKSRMKEGVYKLSVNQYYQRESKDVGFEVEFDFMGKILHFAYDKPVKNTVDVIKFSYTHSNGIEVIESLESTSKTKEVWGITTNKYHKVNLMMLSPNHWESSGSGIGNKHYMFMLDGCVNPEPARGFFNEFLKEELNEHRKVFEIVGAKMVTPKSDEQLSGLGFSNTQRASILCRVSGSFNRTIKVMF